MQIVRFISRLIVGAVFTFSGFVKCIDPLGTVYKINEYLIEFELDQFTKYAVLISVIMCGLELLIGLMLLAKTGIKFATWMALLFMAFYTPLTLYLAIFNPVSDCGCFGDALIITNWQTFLKNVVLIILTIILFINKNDIVELFSPKYRWLFFIALAGAVFGFEQYSLNHVPIIDFRPYYVGANIQEGMEIPEGTDEEIPDYTFIYERDGKTAEFTLDNLPGEEWNFVERKGDDIVPPEAAIHDFSISDMDGYDITDDVLNSNYVCLLIAYDLDKSDTANQTKINTLATLTMQAGHRFICLTSSFPEDIDTFKFENNIPYEFCITDPTTLKTIVRANPGLLVLKNGTILNKWHHKHLPSPADLLIELQAVEY